MVGQIEDDQERGPFSYCVPVPVYKLKLCNLFIFFSRNRCTWFIFPSLSFILIPYVPVHNVSDEATVRGGGAGMDTVPGTT